jgi:hypothetical protein
MAYELQRTHAAVRGVLLEHALYSLTALPGSRGRRLRLRCERPGVGRASGPRGAVRANAVQRPRELCRGVEVALHASLSVPPVRSVLWNQGRLADAIR